MIKTQEEIILRIKDLKTLDQTIELIAFIKNLLENSEYYSLFKQSPHLLANLYNELALGYLHNQDLENAEQSLLNAYNTDPKHINALRNLANMYFQRGDFTKAQTYLKEAIEILPESTDLVYHLGICLSSLGKPDEALLFFKKTCEQNNNFPGGFYWAGQCLMYQEKFEEAYTYFTKAYEFEKENEALLRSLAVCAFNTKQYSKAIALCDELTILIGSDQIFSYKLKGDAYLALGETREAVKNHVILASIERECEGYVFQVIQQLKSDNHIALVEYTNYASELLPEFSEKFSECLNS